MDHRNPWQSLHAMILVTFQWVFIDTRHIPKDMGAFLSLIPSPAIPLIPTDRWFSGTLYPVTWCYGVCVGGGEGEGGRGTGEGGDSVGAVWLRICPKDFFHVYSIQQVSKTLPQKQSTPALWLDDPSPSWSVQTFLDHHLSDSLVLSTH